LRQASLVVVVELETTQLTVEQIAAKCGLGTSTSLRARFRVAVGTTPTAYESILW